MADTTQGSEKADKDQGKVQSNVQASSIPPNPPNPWQGLPLLGGGPRKGGRSLGFKFFLLGVLAAFLCIPLTMVWGLVKERERNYRAVTAEIGQQWGADQTVGGPLLAVPVVVQYTERKDNKDIVRRDKRTVLIAPEDLAIDGGADTSRRVRGIHEAIVYKSTVGLKARFEKPDLTQFSQSIISVDWTRAKLVLSISDLKGIEEITVRADGKKISDVEPGFGFSTNNQNVSNGRSIQFGLHAQTDISSTFADDGSDVTFDVQMAFKGSQTLSFIPVGATTKASLKSKWPHPSFSGTFLPTEREVSETGFAANWAVSKLARSIPQIEFASVNNLQRFHGSSFGVRFYQPVDFYRLVDRAVKYGVLFIGMAFLVIFATEILSKGRMHVVHYTMAGLMVIMFYVLLLAIAEIAGFSMAYAIAAGATGAVLAGFVASVFKGRRATVLAFTGFTGLYGLLYLVLRLEDAALLAGAITGFAILTAMMFATRNVDWSGSNAEPVAAEA